MKLLAQLCGLGIFLSLAVAGQEPPCAESGEGVVARQNCQAKEAEAEAVSVVKVQAEAVEALESATEEDKVNGADSQPSEPEVPKLDKKAQKKLEKEQKKLQEKLAKEAKMAKKLAKKNPTGVNILVGDFSDFFPTPEDLSAFSKYVKETKYHVDEVVETVTEEKSTESIEEKSETTSDGSENVEDEVQSDAEKTENEIEPEAETEEIPEPEPVKNLIFRLTPESFTTNEELKEFTTSLVSKYAPARTFIVIEDNSNFSGDLAKFALENEYVMALLDLPGQVKISQQLENVAIEGDHAQLKRKNLSRYLKWYK